LSKKTNPYSALPPQAFWRSGVAEAGVFGLRDLWASKWILPKDARFATYGSCFAQHISRALVARQIGWLDAEPAPGKTPPDIAKAFNYGVFSSRTGNIYTAAQLLILAQLATGVVEVEGPELWEDGGRFYDSLRPAIEPNGFVSRDEALLSRATMAGSFLRSVADSDVFVFTLGLTEGWENTATGQPYALCPGTVAGTFDADAHVFRNYGFSAIAGALSQALSLMRRIRPGLRVLLTVSPVPLTATAAGGHVLVATTYSKSVLRAVAGECADSDPDIDYFPSYEIITGAPTRGAFFEPNLRSVAQAGVDVVMGHFFRGLNLTGPALRDAAPKQTPREAEILAQMEAEELACEEATLEQFNDA
jgi:GSCFA family